MAGLPAGLPLALEPSVVAPAPSVVAPAPIFGGGTPRRLSGGRWEFILANSDTMETIGKLRAAHSRTLTVDLNKSGSASCWTPTGDELSRQVWPWSTCIKAQHTDSEHNSEVFWSGPVNSRNTLLAAGRCSFTAVGWFERLMHLNLLTEVSFTNTDAGAIAEALLAAARVLDPRLPITLGTVELSRLRTITYAVDQNIGQAIIDLTQLEAGFDWYIHPVTRTFNVVARRGVERENARWFFIGDGLSEHSNLSECEEVVDGSTIVNDIRPRGQFASGLATDGVSQDDYGVFMEAPSLSDVVDTNILIAYANAEIVYRSQPRITYTMTPKPSSDAKVPKLFRDFDLGDTTYLVARRDYVDTKGVGARVFGATLSISDAGVESLASLQAEAYLTAIRPPVLGGG